MMTKVLTAILLGSLGFAAGCSSAEAEVSGIVTVEGQPLREGDIIFEEVDQSVTPAAAKIVDGKYELRVLPGSKRVRINASRATKKIDPVMGSAARESMIAPEFNLRSTLKATITPGKNDKVNFEVRLLP
jgi:hypothetical protein